MWPGAGMLRGALVMVMFVWERAPRGSEVRGGCEARLVFSVCVSVSVTVA